MKLTRRDFLKATSAVATALGLPVPGLLGLRKALGTETSVLPPVVWLQAQSCTGCSVSLINTISMMPIEELLLNVLDLDFHPTVMAGAGEIAVGAAEAAYNDGEGPYILVVEGAIPTGENGLYCHLWEIPGEPPDGENVVETALDVVQRYAASAHLVIAVGTCAAYGGMVAGAPNPTGAMGVQDVVGEDVPIVNIPGCPAHPDWIVGAIAYVMANGAVPPLDRHGRPEVFFGTKIHERCPRRHTKRATELGEYGCLNALGCNGPNTGSDCPVRMWNAAEAGGSGVNWCIGAGSPCYGCTEPSFPDRMAPFYKAGQRKLRAGRR
ncbi:MAG: hydrogenase small subunit [Phycisphaerae bacterium]